MKLTELQIQKLYTFTQKHYVDWYDVQTELVDHLANGIEGHLIQNPNATFESALNSEFKKFGIMGFNDFIKEKTKALNTHYRKLVWTYFINFFKLPKILMTMFLIWAYYQLLILLPNRLWIVAPTAILLLVIPIWKLYQQSQIIRRVKKETNKKWLFDNIALQLGGLIHFLQIVLQVGFFNSEGIWSNTSNFIFSVLIVLFSLTLYVAIYIVSPELRLDISKQHPEYKFD
jgi:hypothetical protein